MNKVAEDKRVEELNKALVKTEPLVKNKQIRNLG